jgi:hypothetical protein
MCSFIVVYERSITKCDLINNIIKTIFFLIILNIWIYYTISFCRFTFCFYILMAKQTNRRKRSIFNETHLQKIFHTAIGFYVKTMSAHGSHLEWRSWSPDTILKVYYPRTIHAMFALNWLTPMGNIFKNLLLWNQ